MQGTCVNTAFLSVEFSIYWLIYSIFRIVILVVWTEARAECAQPAVHSGVHSWIYLHHLQYCEMKVTKATVSCEEKAKISQGLSQETHTHKERKSEML